MIPVVIGLTVACVLAGWWWLTSPALNPIPDAAAFAKMLRLLMARGVHTHALKGTARVYRRTDRTCFLIFEKTLDGGSPGFVAWIPRVASNIRLLERVRADLDARGIPVAVHDGLSPRIATFTFGRDIGAAYLVAQVIAGQMMGVDLHKDCDVAFFHCVTDNHPRLTGVDAPDARWW